MVVLRKNTVARGFERAGQGNPDEARAARYILKDYVNARLLFCIPPPGVTVESFNAKTHELAMERAEGTKRAPVTRVGKNADTFVRSNAPTKAEDGTLVPALNQGHKSQSIDKSFFTTGSNMSARAFVQGSARNGQEFARAKLYPHQNSIADDGSTLTGRRARIAAVLTSAGADVRVDKMHKKKKKVKARSGRGYD